MKEILKLAGDYDFTEKLNLTDKTRITKRDQNDLSLLKSGVVFPFTYLFDLAHFTTSIEAACPQIQLFQSEQAVLEIYPHISRMGEENELRVWDPSGRNEYHHTAKSIIANIETWRPTFDKWLEVGNHSLSVEKPIVITFGAALLRFPMTYDPPSFIATFGGILRASKDIRTMAAAVLFALSEKYSLGIEPQRGIQPGKFYGVHLRTASDALKVGWPGYDIQSSNYLRGGLQSSLSTIYLASGNPPDAMRFTQSAETMGMHVAMKTDLLEWPGLETEKAMLANMTWDQLGIVDYEVLLRASKFGGMFESSLSWAVTNRRNVVEGNGTWEMIYEGHQGLEGIAEGPEAFMDGLSTIYGPKDLGGLRWQFPMALWPQFFPIPLSVTCNSVHGIPGARCIT